MLRVIASGILFFACLAFYGTCTATTLNELKVGVRVIDFVSNPPRGKTSLAIVFDGASKASTEDAQAIADWLRSGVNPAKSELVPALVDIRQSGWVDGYQIAIIAGGTERYFDTVLDYARRNHTLTITSDLSCVRGGKCAVGVPPEREFEVVINRQVAESCGFEFVEAFRMLVMEY